MSDQFTSVQWDRDESNQESNIDEPAHQIPDALAEEDELENEEESQSELIQPGNASLSDKEPAATNEDVPAPSEVENAEKYKSPVLQDSGNADVAAKLGHEDTHYSDHDDAGSGLLPSGTLSELLGDGGKKATVSTNANILGHSQTNHQDGEIESSQQHEGFYIETQTSSPITEYDGQNPFTSFLISVSTDSPKFKKKNFHLRRRYSDFKFLYDCLTNDYPTLIIPPLPNKQRLEYIKGGRFTDEFTNKRAVSLHHFLRRVCKHPVLRTSQIFHIFLEDSDYWETYKSNLKISSISIDSSNSTSQNLETMTDYIMNSFKKPSYESKHKREFQEIQDKSTRLQENLIKIDHIYSKVLTKQQDISDDFSKFSEEFVKLNTLLSNDFDGKSRGDQLDPKSKEISGQFTKFSSNLGKISERSYFLNHDIEYNYLTSLKDLEHYINQLKNLVKIKESKSLDYEMLSSYLEKAKQEKEYLMNGGSVTSSTEATITFLTRKLESMAGLGGSHQHGNLTNERIEKLNSRIALLEKEKKNAFSIFEKFETDILEEFQQFEKIKNEEINESLRSLSDSYLEYYTNLLNDWQSLDVMTNPPLSLEQFENKLSDQDELFSHNDVLKNDELLGENLRKLKDHNAV